MMKIDYQRAVQLRIPVMDAHPDRHFRATVFICDEYQNFATVGGDNPTGDERFLSISRQPKCIPIVATQSVSSLNDALPNEGVKTLLQAFRTKVFLTRQTRRRPGMHPSCAARRTGTRISYTVSESSTNANVGLLSGRTSSSKGSVSASKQYQKHKEPLFEEKVFFDLNNMQSVVVAFDGITPLPPTYCYLKPDFLPATMSWFEQERIGFDPKKVRHEGGGNDGQWKARKTIELFSTLPPALGKSRCDSHIPPTTTTTMTFIQTHPNDKRYPTMSFDVIIPFLKPIEHLLSNKTVSEIMVNPDGSVWMEENGQIILQSSVRFEDGALLTSLEGDRQSLREET